MHGREEETRWDNLSGAAFALVTTGPRAPVSAKGDVKIQAKEKVLTFQGVVDDIGADRGIMIAETGFQSGAHDVAMETNIHLFRFDEFEEAVKPDVLARARESLERTLWDISRRMSEAFWPRRGDPVYKSDEEALTGFYTTQRDGVDEESNYSYSTKVYHIASILKMVRLGEPYPFVVDSKMEGGTEILKRVKNDEELVFAAGGVVSEVECWLAKQERAIEAWKRSRGSR